MALRGDFRFMKRIESPARRPLSAPRSIGSLLTLSLALASSILVTVTAARAQSSSTADSLMAQASGTSVNPASAPMEMLMMQHGPWSLMLHGQLFLNHVNDSGPRGGEKTFSTNWVMGMASRPVGGGTLMFRSMLSLEPATISGRKYPELFQTGETAYGKQLIDGQHPHDFFMELAAEYAHRLGAGTAYVYAAPVGDPALGPVAFPHRASAMELPQATLGHHFQDSTHIAFNVLTTGYTLGMVTAEASAFHGGEPDEDRWDIDGGRINSWSARLRLQPDPNLEMQASFGHLEKPEQIEPGYENRTTASVSYNLPLLGGSWSSSVVFGRSYKEVHARSNNSYLAETVLSFLERHHLTARAEVVDKDELFPQQILKRVPHPPLHVQVFRIEAYTAGYTFDFLHTKSFRTGVGANVTWYRYPPVLTLFYGEKPHAVIVYLRARLGGSMMESMPGMDHMHM
jgi:hypothetical protein